MHEAKNTSTDSPREPLGWQWTARPDPPLWWALTQVIAIATHVPLSVLRTVLASKASLLAVSSVVGISAIGLYLLLGRLVSKWTALAFVTAALIGFWHSGGIWGSGSMTGGLPALVLFALLTAAAVKYASHLRFRFAAFVASVTLAGVIGFLVAVDLVGSPPVTLSVQQPVGPIELMTTPDIALIILDGYARQDVLESMYGYDNQPFLDHLRDSGFDVADASVANYSITHLSLAALLNMSYMHADGANIGRNDLQFLAGEIAGANELVNVLKENGYTYVHAETTDWHNRCGEHVDVCLPGSSPSITTYSVLKGTLIGGLIFRDTVDPATDLNVARIDQLVKWRQTTASWTEAPTFSFFHLPLPHPPLFLDDQCRVRAEPELSGRIMNDGNMSASQLEKRRQAWVEQIQCANRTIKTFLNQVDEDAIVVLLSDHGPDSHFTAHFGEALTVQGIQERFPNLTAVRMPKECRGTIPPDVDLVNVFRLVLNCISERRLDRLPTTNHLASFSGPILEIKREWIDADDG